MKSAREILGELKAAHAAGELDAREVAFVLWFELGTWIFFGRGKR